MKGQPK